MTPEQKLLQNEIKRELRREFELIRNNNTCKIEISNDSIVEKQSEPQKICDKKELVGSTCTQSVSKPVSHGRAVEELVDLPPITVPLVVGRNMLHRYSEVHGLHSQEVSDIIKYPLYTRVHDHKIPIRSLSEPPIKREKIVSPQALTYETFSIKTIGKGNKHSKQLYSSQESNHVGVNARDSLNILSQTPISHHVKDFSIHKRSPKPQYRKNNKYQPPTSKQVPPLQMEKDILTGQQLMGEKDFIGITTLASKPSDPFISHILPEIMGRKITS